MDRRQYTEQVLSSLRRVTHDEREAIRQELDGHMEDHMEALRELGYEEEEAEARTLAAMGDPAEVGRELNRQYPFRWLVAGWIAKALAVVFLCLLVLSLFSPGSDRVAGYVSERLHPSGEGRSEITQTAWCGCDTLLNPDPRILFIRGFVETAPGDTYVTLSQDRFGQSFSLQIPLPEEVTP